MVSVRVRCEATTRTDENMKGHRNAPFQGLWTYKHLWCLDGNFNIRSRAVKPCWPLHWTRSISRSRWRAGVTSISDVSGARVTPAVR